MSAKSANDRLYQGRLAGKSVCFAGKFSPYSDALFRQFLQVEGINVVEDVSASLDYLVLNGASGFGPQKKEAEQLSKKNQASINILPLDDFTALLAPTRDEVLQLLHAGDKGIERLNRYYDNSRCQPYLPSLAGLDLRGADLRGWRTVHNGVVEGIDLRGANLADTRLGYRKCLLDGAKLDNALLLVIDECSATDLDFSVSQGLSAPTKSDFTRSRFRGQNLIDCNFTGSTLGDTDLRGTNLVRATFTGVSLRGVDLSEAKMTGAKLNGADLRGCKFVKAELTDADFSGADVAGADFTDAQMYGANLKDVDVSQAVGLSPASVQSKANIGPAVQGWLNIGKKSRFVETQIKLQHSQEEIEINLKLWRNDLVVSDDKGNYWSYDRSVPPAQVLGHVVNRWHGAILQPGTVTAKGTKCPKTNMELLPLAARMWCELFGVAAPDEDELKKQKKALKASKKSQLDEWVQILRNDPNGVQKWNDDVPHTIKHLKGKLHGLDLSKTSLAGWRCEHVDCKDGNFAEADLRQARVHGTRFIGADFTQANLQEAYLLYGSLKNAKCQRADFTLADLRHVDLCGTDLSQAILKDAKLDGAKFDETTKFPKGFKPPLDMKWQGAGPSPALAVQVAKLKAKTPLDIDAFMKRLEAGVDGAKLDKALAMLKADRFKLYAQVTDDHLVGIVKSQGDPNLVYSCKLASNGVYGCCTQNLNICGGLRGSLCKHLLVLIVGLTRAGDLDPNVIDTWVLSSKGQKPVLDKDAMSETFLRYKSAEAGEVDWRPTETIPEDYYAM